MLCFIYQPHFYLLPGPVLSTSQYDGAEGVRGGKRGGIKRTQQGTEQEEVDAEVAFDTHSTVWMVHGAVAPVLLDRHTEEKKTTTTTDILENKIQHFF